MIDDVDLAVVWEIIEIELPRLKPQILEILQTLNSTRL
jgi:uncharacterized protein with HEPN domain